MVGPWGLDPQTSTLSLTLLSFLHTLAASHSERLMSIVRKHTETTNRTGNQT
jgi:hypothetical protein